MSDHVRMPFRIVGAILGVLMLLVGGLMTTFVAIELATNGADALPLDLVFATFGTLPFGLACLWAAYTGRDPIAGVLRRLQ